MHGYIRLFKDGVHRIIHEDVAGQGAISILENLVETGLIADAKGKCIETCMEDMLGKLVNSIVRIPQVGIEIFEGIIGMHHGLTCCTADDFSLALSYRGIPRAENEDSPVTLVDI